MKRLSIFLILLVVVISGCVGQETPIVSTKDGVVITDFSFEYSPIYAREYLTETKPSKFVYGVPSEIYELDEIDEKIIKELSKNARINIVDLSKKTNLTRDIINYRLKKLTKEKIIVQYRCYLNLQNFLILFLRILVKVMCNDNKN